MATGRYSVRRLGQAMLTPMALMVSSALNAQSAANIFVTTTADDVIKNGNCTLREAVIAANTDTTVDRCHAGSGADTISVPAGTYRLSLTGSGEDAAYTGDLDIIGQVTIRGAGTARTIIDGGWSGYQLTDPDTFELLDRVIHVLSGSRLNLTGIAVEGGACAFGGGIFNAGTLSIVDSAVQSNYATWDAYSCGAAEATEWGGAGIQNVGDLLVSRSAIVYNEVFAYDYQALVGGGLLNEGTARVERSVIVGNAAAQAGGVSNLGDLQLTDTLVDHNGARFDGGGLWNSGTATLTRTAIIRSWDGAGIVNVGSSLVVINSTVSRNVGYRQLAAGINSTGAAQIINSTIADNNLPDYYYFGAGIAGPVQLRNSIVAGNGAGDCVNPDGDSSQSVSSLGNNVDSDGTCGLSAAGDLPQTDPGLGPLADNGGPTPTHALLPGSTAIDRIAAADCGVSTDQRGVPRSQLLQVYCDVGAYEFYPAGDIVLIINHVKALYQRGLLTSQQELALLVPLKDARMAAMQGDAPTACRLLVDFSSLVTGYRNDGRITLEASQPLLDDSLRVRALICV